MKFELRIRTAIFSLALSHVLFGDDHGTCWYFNLNTTNDNIAACMNLKLGKLPTLVASVLAHRPLQPDPVSSWILTKVMEYTKPRAHYAANLKFEYTWACRSPDWIQNSSTDWDSQTPSRQMTWLHCSPRGKENNSRPGVGSTRHTGWKKGTWKAMQGIK